jgi:hypothetical protein
MDHQYAVEISEALMKVGCSGRWSIGDASRVHYQKATPLAFWEYAK